MRNRQWWYGGIFLFSATVPAMAYAGNYTLAVTPSSAQTIRYDRGIASIDSVQKVAVIRVVNVAGNERKPSRL